MSVLVRALLGLAAVTPLAGSVPRSPRFYELCPADGGGARELERLTRSWVGAPYLRSPLGEEAPPDLDPRFRLDAFDCTTFVETALALSRCRLGASALAELDAIRYADAAPSFETRRHLATSQWVPELVKAGLLVDISDELGGPVTLKVPLRMSLRRWRRRRIARTLDLPEARVPIGVFALDVIPLERAMAVAEKIPSGTVLNLVRVDWVLSPDLITHQGLVLDRGAQKILRHASPDRGRVVDEPLARALARWRAAKKKWPIAGVSLLRVR